MGSEIASDAEKLDMSALVAHWDFSQDIPTTRAVDTGPNAMHGQLINMPGTGHDGLKLDRPGNVLAPCAGGVFSHPLSR